MSYPSRSNSGYGIQRRSVRAIQGSRSKRSQSMDSLKRAPIAKNTEQWKKDPSHFDLKGVDTPMVDDESVSNSKDIYVGVPSLSQLRNVEAQIPDKLQDGKLMRYYALLKTARMAWIGGRLPSEYFVGLADAGGASGNIPKDVFALTNIDSVLDEYQKEVTKRKLSDKYSLMIDSYNTDAERRSW